MNNYEADARVLSRVKINSDRDGMKLMPGWHHVKHCHDIVRYIGSTFLNINYIKGQ
jgi:hypothetical protein